MTTASLPPPSPNWSPTGSATALSADTVPGSTDTASADLHDLGSAFLCACHECGLLHRIDEPRDEHLFLCRRCGAPLLTLDSSGNRRALAYAVTALVLLVLANVFPLVTIDMQGSDNATSIFGAAVSMWTTGSEFLAVLVFVTTMLIPSMELGFLLYLLVPTANGRARRHAVSALRAVQSLRPWGMTGVFMLGILVALVKLGSYADIVIGVSFWSLAALLVVSAATTAAFQPDALWRNVVLLRSVAGEGVIPAVHLPVTTGGKLPIDPTDPLQADGTPARFVCCHTCKLVLRGEPEHGARCPRCATPLHRRKAASLSATMALLIAAIILYIPANLLPIMNTGSLLGTNSDTIMSGVVFFWVSGSWPLALLVFFASIMVPLLKMIALSILVFSSARGSTWQTQERTRLYRMVEFVGRWSMLDIYVIAIMTALVQMGQLASITAGPAAVAFGLVVILTMLSSMQFDPRLIWDPLGDRDGPTA